MDEEALKTLKRIESLLSKSINVASKPTIAGGKTTPTARTTTFQGTAKELKSVDQAARKLTQSLTGLNQQVRTSRATFYALNKTMKGRVSQQQQTPQNSNGLLQKIGQTFQNMFSGRSNGPTSSLNSVLGGQARALAKNLSGTGLALAFFATQLRNLGKPLADVTNDIFHLQARGVSAADSLASLYVQAGKAGLSLGEYVKILETAETSLVRSGSFAEFNKEVTVTTDRLANLGIFGQSAMTLAVQMREAGTELGISQKDLTAANAGQLSVLEKMRTSGLMTAESFMAVVKQLQESEVVQNSLLGLAPSERAARLNQLTDMATFGKQIGLSTEASRKLGEAFINQRNSTLAQRQESSARIQQAAAALGMNSTDAATLARLSRKKNLTPQDQAQMLPLAGQLQSMLQSRLNDDSQPIVQGIYEEIENMLNSGNLRDILKTSGQATATLSSGEKANQEFAKATPDFLKGTRMLLQYAEGLSKNPIATAITSAVGAAIGSAAFGFGIAKGFGLTLPKILPSLGGMFTGLKTGASALGSAGSFASLTKNAAPFFTKFAGTVINGLSTAFRAISTFIAPAIGAIVETWTGDINAAFGGGDWIDRINNIIFGAVRAIPASITGLLDAVFGSGLTNWLDRALTMARAGFQVLINGIVDSVIAIIPDSFTPDWLKNWSKNGHDKLETMFQTMDKLMADSSQTLTTIGEKNQEVMKNQVDVTNKGVTQVKAAQSQVSNVIYGTDGITANVLATARNMQPASFATPAPVLGKQVVVPTQDAPVQIQQATTPPQTLGSTGSTAGQPSIVDLLTQLVQLMQQSVLTEQQQTQLTEQLLRIGNKPVFRDHETSVRQILGAD